MGEDDAEKGYYDFIQSESGRRLGVAGRWRLSEASLD